MGSKKVPISVIIPTYNRAQFLQECLNSILSQTISPAEVIVVDDGSTDSTEEVIKIFPSVSYYKKAHSGISKTLNFGLGKASQEYLSFLDSDDLWNARYLESQFEFLKSEINADGVFCHHRRVFQFKDNRALSEQQKIEEQRKYPAKLKAGLLIKRQSFIKVGFFDETITQGDFIDWYMRAVENGLQFVMNKENLLIRRIHDSNMTSDRNLNSSSLLKALAKGLKRRKENN